MNSPIVLFAYARLGHLTKTVDALKKNYLAEDSDLIIYSDAPGSPGKNELVDSVRKYLATITGFKTVSVHYRDKNHGLANSIIAGVTEVLEHFEWIIVLEDDMVTSPYFLNYMNEGLRCFATNERVGCIHGWLFQTRRPLSGPFFLPGADCWGWGTWRRVWKNFNPDGQYLLDELKRRNLLRAFDFNGTYPYSKMLEDQISGLNDSWAVRWRAITFLEGQLTLYPTKSLVHNIGNDSSGTHCGNSNIFDTELAGQYIKFENLRVCHSIEGQEEFEFFFKKTESKFFRKMINFIIRKIKKMV